jgi:HSP20 family protein
MVRPIHALHRFPARELSRLARGLELPLPAASAAFPPAELWGAGDELVLRALLPGVPKGALRIDVDGDELTLAGERPAAPEGTHPLRSERERGPFERRFRLPWRADAESAVAVLQDGVLELRLRRSAADRPRRVPITRATDETPTGDHDDEA